MTNTVYPVRWREMLAMAVASVSLHYALLGGVVPLALPGQGGQAPASPPAVVAQVRFDAPPGPRIGPAGVPPLFAPMPDDAAPKVRAQPSPTAPPAQEALDGYMVALAPSAELTFDLLRVDADGMVSNGNALIDWQQDGMRYRLRTVSDTQELVSEGAVGATGILPRVMTERRAQRAQTATHFDHAAGRISFSASQALVELAPGAQDKASVALQLAGIGRAGRAQLEAGVALTVADERDARAVSFVFAGEEQIDTGMGRIRTWRMTRQVPPGSYHAQLDIWLAPDHDCYPVRLRTTYASGAVMTKTIRRIVIKEN